MMTNSMLLGMVAVTAAICMLGTPDRTIDKTVCVSTVATGSDADKATPSDGTEEVPKTPIVLYELNDNINYTTAFSGMSFKELPKPESAVFFPDEHGNNWNQARFCTVDWGEEAYKREIESGKSSFLLTGTPGPGLLDEADRLLWDQGLLYVEESSYPVIKVNVVPKQKLQFKVDLAASGEDEYIAWFSFPAPHGSSSVLLEASLDGENWFSQEEWVGNEFSQEEIKVHMRIWDEEDNPVFRPSDRRKYYFRMKVYGSPYEGETDVITVGEDTEIKNDDEMGGNRGGVTSDEVTRVLQETTAPVPMTEVKAPAMEEGSRGAGEIKEIIEKKVAPTVYESSAEAGETKAELETFVQQETPPEPESEEETVVAVVIEQEPEREEASGIPGFLAAAIGAVMLMIFGAGSFWLRRKKLEEIDK